MLEDLLCRNAEVNPMGYAKALQPRIEKLLAAELPSEIRQQLTAVLEAIGNQDIVMCAGLDRLHHCLDEWERRYT
jgi:hypothetical protein